MKTLRTLAIWLLLAPAMMCTASNFYFRTVDVTDGLADNFVRDIIRDSYGYVWFSTINGLSRYDGYRFHNYLPQEFGATTNDISMIRETADSTLWMLCLGNLYTYERARDTWKKDGATRLSSLGINGSVKLFYVDDRHHLWVHTENGLYHYDYAQNQLYQITNYNKLPISHIVSKNGTTLVVTSDYKIYEVAVKEKRLIPIAQAPAITYSRDSRVYLDNFQNLWIYNSHSLAGKEWLLSFKTRQWRQLPELKLMGNVFVNAIAEDREGFLWVGTGNAGIQVFEYQNGGMILNKVRSLDAFPSRSSHMSCLYLDDTNTMWVGSAKLGIALSDLNSPSFNMISTGEQEDVSSIIKDRKGNLWIGFDGAGIMMKSPTGQTTRFSASQQQLPSNIVTSLTTNKDGTVLAGTYGSGIAKFEGNRFTALYPDQPQLKYVKDMTVDVRGNLWVATVDRGIVRVGKDGRIVNYTSENSSLISNGVLCLANDSLRDIIYIGTASGVSAFDCTKEQFISHPALEKLKGIYVTSIMVCSRNMLWIGSRNGLWVYRSKDGTIDHLTTEQGMSHNTVRALAKSKSRIWASTDNGLTCIYIQNIDNDQISYECFPFLDSDGLHNVIFSNNAALTSPDGMVLLGCYSGYVSVQPEDIVPHQMKLQVQFTEYRINGEKAPQFLSDYTLKHNERLSVFLSAMVPTQKDKVKYFYRFKGEKEWVRVPGNMLYFASLNTGKHILQVKAQLPGMKESDIAELPFRVKPPLWLSKPAILLYLLLLGAFLYLLYKSLRRRQQRELNIKQMEINLKRYEMEEDKIRFFTNISHDLKTPLTLVVAPLEKIRQNALPAPIRTELDTAWRNARQLYDLVMELLDFRRLDVGMEKLNLKHGDIVSFVRQTVQGFAYYTTLKRIKLQLQLPPVSAEINFDESKMRRIITNLLSNAYKYNTDNGSVMVSLQVSDQQMTLNVADTGIGVHDKRRIFDRFVQETHGQEQEGSGLGLHIVKNYVDMMGGTITVTDNIPKGSVFTVTIPVTESMHADIEELTPAEPDTLTSDIIPDDDAPSKLTILVVDDNRDARLFLQRSLDDEYHVLLAANGKEALEQLSSHDEVNLIVSDVMMPVMDGIELFRRIKGNIKYSHIPVILLTAKSSEENIVAGLEEGVADYITKPFSLSVLRLRIKKILEWTQNVYNRVANGIEIKPSEITVSSLDEELISHVIAYIEKNISDVDYSVAQLSSDVGMSRGHLYKKLMAITGKSPLEFSRIIKLKRGKSLMDQGKTNISEVADMVGLSPKQFAHYFKQMYGSTPSDYLRKNK